MNDTTKDTIKRAGWTAVQAFIGAFIVLAPGIYQAKNFNDAKAAAVAAVIAGVAAAVSAIKNIFVTPPGHRLR